MGCFHLSLPDGGSGCQAKYGAYFVVRGGQQGTVPEINLFTSLWHDSLLTRYLSDWYSCLDNQPFQQINRFFLTIKLTYLFHFQLGRLV